MYSAASRNVLGRSPSAKSLVLDLLSTVPPGHPVPVGALVSAAALFGIGENNLRVGLARMRAQGLVDSGERGQYRLGAAAQAVDRRVRSWRAAEESVHPWDGTWVGVHGSGPRERSEARRWRAALRLLGFRTLEPRLWVRPDNLAGGVDGVRSELGGLVSSADTLVFALSGLDPATERRARGLWKSRTLEGSYEEMLAALEASRARLATLSREEAMVESFLVGGEAVRRIVLDPLLPDPIVDTGKRRALVSAMRRYDRLGRRCWKGWSGTLIALERSPGDASASASQSLSEAG